MIRVVTFLWTDPTYRWNSHFIYGADHVRRLFAAVDRNLTMPHENVLITDRPDGDYGRNVRVVPLWDDYRDLPGWRGVGRGCWTRLRAFSPEMADFIGPRFVWLDLDCVITGGLDVLLDRPEEFVAWRDVHPSTPYCGSMMMMTAGARAQVWDEFRADHRAAMKRAQGMIGTDQAWIGTCLGRGEATWGPEHGVYNYRVEVSGRANLPANARLVFFTGPNDPSMPQIQAKHPWIGQHWLAA